MNGVIYARYSCEKQTENSILGQIRECTNFAKQNSIDVIGVYKDEAISGRSVTKRKGFLRMIDDALLHKFDVIIVWKGDRFSRSRADAARYKGELKKLGIRVLSATEANITGPEAILMDGINEAFAEYFSVELAAKVERGMTQNVIEGKFNGGKIPLGYKLDEHRKIVVDESKAFIIIEAFDRYVNEELTVLGLQQSFKAKGYVNNDGHVMGHSAVRCILRNPKYYGRYEFKGTVNMNVYPALISKELFDAAQAKMKLNEKNRRKMSAQVPFYLIHKVYCMYDHQELVRTSGKSPANKRTYYYYKCAHDLENEHPPVRINKDELEDMVFQTFFNTFWNKPHVRESIYNKFVEKYKYLYQAVEPLQRMKEDTEEKLSNIKKAIEAGAPYDLFTDRILELQKLKANQDKRINECLAYTEEEFYDTMNKYMEYLFGKEDFDQTMKLWIVNKYINRIYLSDKECVVMFNYSDEHYYDYIVEAGYTINNNNSSMVHQIARMLNVIHSLGDFSCHWMTIPISEYNKSKKKD